MDYFFTSESVSEGHPDKIADQISDAVLDAYLKEDERARVACEVLITKKELVIAGEVDSKVRDLDVEKVARDVLQDIGYDSEDKGLDFKTCRVQNLIHVQSQDIKNAVRQGEDQGAGDQGLMFGYAVKETPNLMPLSIDLAHSLVRELSQIRKKEKKDLWPDAKSQVTIRYKDGQPQDISRLVISTQHSPDFSLEDVRSYIKEEFLKKSKVKDFLSKDTKVLINPGGKFHIGGPVADCGLTGRKVIVDTYGGHGAHGGGAFSGKDPSKVDRSGAYIARHIAKNVVEAGLCEKCLIQLSYAIGESKPLSFFINPFGTSSLPLEKLKKACLEIWDLRPSLIIKSLDLLKRRYQETASYGHFGREGENFTWEKTNKIDELRGLV